MIRETAMLPRDWHRNPGMALRAGRYFCFEHESLEAYIDVCPPESSEEIFDTDSNSYAIAKLYTSHDDLEGVQFRDQQEIEEETDIAIVVRDLADRFYEQFAGDLDVGPREEPEPGLSLPEDWPESADHRTLDDF